MNIRQELSEYLGKHYEPSKLTRYASQSERDKESLYYYTWRAWEEWWLPHLTWVRENVPVTSSVLDYQAGAGQFGVTLLDDYGYNVSFAEDDNHPGKFLRWRLKQRGVKESVYTLADAEPRDAVIAFGVAQRYGVSEFIERLSELGGRVLFDLDSRESEIPELDNVIRHHVVNGYVNLFVING